MSTTITRICLFGMALLLSCSEDVYIGSMKENQPPKIRITNGPMEGDSTEYRVHFYWLGEDPDGRIEYYEFAMTEGDPIGFDPADTTGLDKWTDVFCTDSIFIVSADKFDTNVSINNNLYARYSKTHTFFIMAVDDRGARSEPAYCSFTALNLAPYAFIESPINPNPGRGQFLGPLISFKWEGKDPIGTPWNYQEVDSIRYMLTKFYGFTIEDMNKDPERFEHLWSPWIWYHTEGDSGKSTIIGDDEILELKRSYIFAVQAKDEAGAVTSIFNMRTNVRHFMVTEPAGPLLTVREPHIGKLNFIGTNFQPQIVYLPGNFSLNFSWKGDASHYGGEISTYRYGWDISDLNDPNDWEVSPSPFHTSAPAIKFFSGIHTLYIEAKDGFGAITFAQIEVNIVPATMERNLLWVDDFYSGDFTQTLYAMPTERGHDAFWINICSRVPGFYADRDIFDTGSNEPNANLPDIQLLWKYKNIIWTYNSERRFNAWYDMVYFIPENLIETVDEMQINLLASFMMMGGHVWTLGKSDREGGLAAVLSSRARVFPLYLKCEIDGPQEGCIDTSGVECMAYRDYCVSILDKVWGITRDDRDMPVRKDEFDALQKAYKDDFDHITARHPELPEELHLWEEVTKPERFFDPMLRGFTYVEVYNPEYWMTRNGVQPQLCFHPMYRMKTRNSTSALNDAVIAFWTTKYANVNSEAPSTVAAPSVHFGIPLWFFNRQEVNAIAEAIFREWQILDIPED